MKALTAVLVIASLCVAIIGGIIWFLGSENPYTPAGYIGYLTKGAIFGAARYKDLQTGPISPGREWLVSVVNVSITPYTYTEPFIEKEAVVSKDNLRVEFQAHIVWRVKPDRVKEFVEHYTTWDPKQNSDQVVQIAYKNFLKEPFRTFVRDKIQSLNGMDIKDNINGIGKEVFDKVNALTGDTPFHVISTVVGNIQYPKEVSDAVSRKLATSQLWEQKQTEIEIEKRDKEKRIIQAEGIARSMEIIKQELTPQYLQHEAIEAQKLMVGSPNHTTVYIPVGPMGVPLTGTFDATAARPKEK
jgi:regulator of protease activity HflC (stomatin/prohibitin superfamily)